MSPSLRPRRPDRELKMQFRSASPNDARRSQETERIVTMPKIVIASTLALLLGWIAPAQGQEPEDAATYKVEARIYRVMTNITGNGLTSRTLPGLEGVFHIVHEKLNDVELVMEGETLTWDGKPEPDDPLIILLAKPNIITREELEASISIGQEIPVQYFIKQGDLYDLREVEQQFVGIELGVTVRSWSKKKRIIELNFRFLSTSVTSREELAGVGLNVGRPIINTTSSEGLLTVHDGEWVCYRIPVESKGYLYLFLLVTRVQPEK